MQLLEDDPGNDVGGLPVPAETGMSRDGDISSMPNRNDGTIEPPSGLVTPSIDDPGTVQVDPDPGNSDFGFDGLPVGPALLPGQQVRVDGPNAALYVGQTPAGPDQPFVVQNFAATDLLAIDGLLLDLSATDTPDGLLVSLSGLRGWAWCPDHPAAPVLLEVIADGAVVSQVLADRFRADLLHAGIGNGCHGFDLPNPATGQTLRLRRATDGIPFGR